MTKRIAPDSACDVYLATNTFTGKRYVGVAKTPEPGKGTRRRWANHLSCARSPRNPHYNSPLHRSIRKHGEDTFVIITLLTEPSCAAGLKTERAMITFYGTKVPNGYNLTDGGEGMPGYKQSPEAIAKTVAFHRGRKRSIETRARLSAAAKARPPRSQESIEKGAAKARGRKQSPESIRKSVEARRGRMHPPSQRAAVSRARRNAPSRTSCGVKGVRRSNKKWMANIKIPLISSRNIYLGSYDTAEEAGAAYVTVARALTRGVDSARIAIVEARAPKKPWGASGLLGVYFRKGRGKWVACVSENGKQFPIGSGFATKEEAAKARLKYLGNKSRHI